jgi:hypothetical protein
LDQLSCEDLKHCLQALGMPRLQDAPHQAVPFQPRLTQKPSIWDLLYCKIAHVVHFIAVFPF